MPAESLQGITGIDPAGLAPGRQVTVTSLQFGQGTNSYLAANAGDILLPISRLQPPL